MPPGGVRHSGRIPKEIAIVLLGSYTDLREISEQAKTIVLTRHGAGIVSKHKLAPDQEMIIRCEHCRVSTVRKPAQGETNGKIISAMSEQSWSRK
jgi:hypothetical protein